MAFFANAAINRLNVQAAIRGFAQNVGGIFVLVYLVRAGVPAPVALAAQGAIFFGRFAVRPLLLPLAKRWGVKPLLIGGGLVLALQYPFIALVRGVDAALLAACVTIALGEASYWVSYHTYFATLGHAEQRGRQLAVTELVVAISGVIGPLYGAWSLMTLGPSWTFGMASVLQALSVLPLLGLPTLRVVPEAPGSWRAARPAVMLMAADGWYDGNFGYVWLLLLFSAVGESYGAYGGALTLAALVGAGASLIIGSDVDSGNGRRAVVLGYGATIVMAAVRAASLASGPTAIVAGGLGGLAAPMMVPPLATATHNIAAQSPCPFRGKLATEGAWDFGAAGACLAAALALRMNVSPQAIALFAIPAIIASAALLNRYYDPSRPRQAVRA